MTDQDHRIYDALALPNEALSIGGVEILRAGIIDDELYVAARRAFADPARWGDVLADMARRIAVLYSAEDTDLSEKEILTEIVEAFAADLGAKKVTPTSRVAKSRKPAKRSTAKRTKKSKSVKRSKR